MSLIFIPLPFCLVGMTWMSWVGPSGFLLLLRGVVLLFLWRRAMKTCPRPGDLSRSDDIAKDPGGESR